MRICTLARPGESFPTVLKIHWPLCTAMQWNAKECKGHLFFGRRARLKRWNAAEPHDSWDTTWDLLIGISGSLSDFPNTCTNCPLLELTIILWHKNFLSWFYVILISKSSFMLSVTSTDHVITSLFSKQDTPHGTSECKETIACQICMFSAEYKESVWEGSNELESKSRRPLQPFLAF